MTLSGHGEHCLIAGTQEKLDLMFSLAIRFDWQSCGKFLNSSKISRPVDFSRPERVVLPDSAVVEKIKVVAGCHVGDFKVLSVAIHKQKGHICIGDEATLSAYAHRSAAETLVHLKIDLVIDSENALRAVATIISNEAIDLEN